MWLISKRHVWRGLDERKAHITGKEPFLLLKRTFLPNLPAEGHTAANK